tara:strand:- start:691 stop:1518 length:828 start_codon:yes stop_codon:yes gene_type:complete
MRLFGERPNTTLLVGGPGAGKTLLIYGIMHHLHSSMPADYKDIIGTENRNLRDEVTEAIARNEWPQRTKGVTASEIGFMLGKKAYRFLDYGGEYLIASSPISRGFDFSEVRTEVILDLGASSGEKEIKLDRRQLKNILFLIPPQNIGGTMKYGQASFQGLESQMKLISELTLRTGGDLANFYSKNVLRYKKRARKIRVHAIFTQNSLVQEQEVGFYENLLATISPELNALVLQTKGQIIPINVYDSDEKQLFNDRPGGINLYNIETLSESLGLRK